MKTTKKCQGTGIAKGYGCKKLVPVSVYNKSNRKYGLGISCGCYSKWLFNSEQGQEIISKATIKATAPRRELEEATAEKKKNTSLSYLLINTKNAVHRYIKERDKHKRCISCNVEWNSDFQAGHFYKAELYSLLKFDYKNIHGQCVKCNIFLEGNVNDYSINLPNRIGKKEYDLLVKRAELSRHKDFKYNRADLIKIREEATELYNELKKV